MCQKPIKTGEQVSATDRCTLHRNFRTKRNILDANSSVAQGSYVCVLLVARSLFSRPIEIAISAPNKRLRTVFALSITHPSGACTPKSSCNTRARAKGVPHRVYRKANPKLSNQILQAADLTDCKTFLFAVCSKYIITNEITENCV